MSGKFTSNENGQTALSLWSIKGTTAADLLIEGKLRYAISGSINLAATKK